MIIKTTAAAALLAGGAGKLVAQAAAGDGLGLGEISNLSATGALILLVVWMMTRTLPAIVKDFREEVHLVRADRDLERGHVKCRYPPGKDEAPA